MESISSATPRSVYKHFKTRLDDTCRDFQSDRPFCDINASRGSLSTYSQISPCPAVRSLGPQDPWPPPTKSAPLNALPDVLWTSILALKESADAFPPLKSAVSAAIALCQLAEVSSSQANKQCLTRSVAHRALQVRCERDCPSGEGDHGRHCRRGARWI